jgi:hypothetical protein
MLSPSGLLELWISRACFSLDLSKQLVEIIKKKSPKASDFDFLSCGSFNRPSPSELFFVFGSFAFFAQNRLNISLQDRL